MNELLLAARQSGLLFADVLPWILAGALAGAALRTVRRIPFLSRLLRMRGASAIPFASAAGAASPLCTLGTVPIVTGLVAGGFPRAAGMAFLASSSIVTPQIALLTAGILGPRIAALQAIGGILAGALAGGILEALPNGSDLFFRKAEGTKPECAVPPSSKGFFTHFAGQLEFSVFWLVVGAFTAQLLSLCVSDRLLTLMCGNPAITETGPAGATALGAAFTASLLSAPLYTCGGAALPVLSMLRTYGIGDGFLIAFLVCGPATRLRSAAALGRLLTPRGLVAWFSFIFIFSALYGCVAARI